MISGFEQQIPQPRHLQRHRARLGLQRAVIVSGPRVEPFRRTGVTLGATQFVGLRFQQAVQGLFDRLPHHLAHVRANLLLLDPKHPVQVRATDHSCYLVHRAVLSCW